MRKYSRDIIVVCMYVARMAFCHSRELVQGRWNTQYADVDDTSLSSYYFWTPVCLLLVTQKDTALSPSGSAHLPGSDTPILYIKKEFEIVATNSSCQFTDVRGKEVTGEFCRNNPSWCSP